MIRFDLRICQTMVPSSDLKGAIHPSPEGLGLLASKDKTKISLHHLERCLLPEVVSDASGLVSVKRPVEYFYASVLV